MKMFNLEILAKSIEASLEIDPSFRFLGDVVIGDEGRFAQVCVNLLANGTYSRPLCWNNTDNYL